MGNRLAKLENLSVKELVKKSFQAANQERKSTVALIAYLGELRERKSFLDLGYNSIYKFCTEGLKLEPGQAYLRMQVASVYKKFPVILEMLELNQLTLTGAGRISPVLTSENIKHIINNCSGKTVKEIEEFIVTLRPKKVVSSGVRKSPIKPAIKIVENSSSNKGLTTEPTVKNNEPEFAFQQERKILKRCEPVAEDQYNFRFSANKEFKEKLQRLAEVMNIDQMEANLSEIIDAAIEIALEKKDPQRKEVRNEKRKAKKIISINSIKTKQDQVKTSSSRYIPSRNRALALKRAGYQCEKNGINGIRCSAKNHLEFEHIVPFAKGGSNDLDNLQIFCRSHNLHKAKQEFGSDFIHNKINSPKE